MTSGLNEKLLLYRLRIKKDPDAYAELYDQYVNRIYRFVLIGSKFKHLRLPDPHKCPAGGDTLPLFDRQPHDLAVVPVRAAVLERVKETLLQIVDVSAPAVRGVDLDLDLEWPS